MNSSERLRVLSERSCTIYAEVVYRKNKCDQRHALATRADNRTPPSASTIPSEPITRSEGQDMAEVMPTLTSATIKNLSTINAQEDE